MLKTNTQHGRGSYSPVLPASLCRLYHRVHSVQQQVAQRPLHICWCIATLDEACQGREEARQVVPEGGLIKGTQGLCSTSVEAHDERKRDMEGERFRALHGAKQSQGYGCWGCCAVPTEPQVINRTPSKG